eukprot:gene5556-6240_t
MFQERPEKDASQKQDNMAILDRLTKELEKMNERFHDLLVRSALINVELGTLFDPEALEILKESEVGCVQCSQKTIEMLETPFELSEKVDETK